MVSPQKLLVQRITLLLQVATLVTIDIAVRVWWLFICQISEALECLVVTDFEDSLAFL